MALINGNNASGKLFDVVDEDGDVLGSFDHISDATECGRAAPWHAGNVNIRRDLSIANRISKAAQEHQRRVRLEMEYAA
jgi:hypothetical protein